MPLIRPPACRGLASLLVPTLVLTAVGCDIIAFADRSQIPAGTGGSGVGGGATASSGHSSGASATASHSASASASSGAVMCVLPADCPGMDAACTVRTCEAGKCGTTFVDANTPTPDQVAGDCHRSVCDGNGNEILIEDDTDVPVDGNPCTDDDCKMGQPSNPPSTAGTLCMVSGGSYCNGTGSCVECVSLMDCPGGMNCVNGVCYTCNDSKKDGTETDTDCGGLICPPCGAGKDCLKGSDCASGVCSAATKTCAGGASSSASSSSGAGGGMSTSSSSGAGGASSGSTTSSSSSSGSPCTGTLTFCGTQCVDTSGDAKNCGACAHDCLGGMCQMGMCTPVTLASGGVNPTWLALDATWVYWTDTGANTVMRAHLDGTGMTTLRQNEGGAWGIWVDATSVYWTNSNTGDVRKAKLDGTSPTTLASTQNGPRAITADAAYVYWVNDNGGEVMKCAIGGCGGMPTKLYADPAGVYPEVIAVDATSVYWTYFSGDQLVMSAALDGSNPTMLAMGNQPLGLAVDANNVYWPDTGNGMVESVGLDGTNQTVLASGLTTPWSIAVDASWAYFPDFGAGVIYKVSLQGGTPITLATNQAGPRRIAIDATAVYWPNYNGGTIMRVAK